MSEVEVRVGDCRCPGTPHPDGDLVWLREKLGLAAGIAIQKMVIDANSASDRLSAAELTGILAEGYLLYGVSRWNLLDANGKSLPVESETIKVQLLDDFERGAVAANKADDLYMAAVLLPLVNRANGSSRNTPTNGSTSVTPPRIPKARKQSKRSSTSTSQTGATATISASPDGDYSSSRS